MATIIEYIKSLLQGEDLSFEQAANLLDVIFEGEVPEIQIVAFLTAMRVKGPVSAELAGLAKSLRAHAVAVKVDIDNFPQDLFRPPVSSPWQEADSNPDRKRFSPPCGLPG